MTEDSQKPLILIVDDVPTIATLTQETVEQLGFATAVRKNATTGLAFVGNNDVDLILLDVELEDSLYNGLETAKLIQSRKDIPIIFLTGDDNIEVFRKADFCSPIYVLMKPYDPKQLKIQIEVALYNREIAHKPPVIVF
jgi:two-component system catabolic regulation response regulator CreB